MRPGSSCSGSRAWLKVSDHCIGVFAVDLDILFTREGVALAVVHDAGIAEQAAEDFGQEVVEELMFLELIGLARGKQLGPAREGGPVRLHALRQGERGQGTKVSGPFIGTAEGPIKGPDTFSPPPFLPPGERTKGEGPLQPNPAH